MNMTFDKQREDWQLPSQPVSSTSLFPGWQYMNRIVIHYPGVTGLNLNDPVTVLRNTQNYYLTSRGYSIGYNVCVDINGVSWELRGDTYKCAANQEVNNDSFAIKIMVNGDTAANAAQIAKVRDLVAQARTLSGKKLPVVTHNSVSQNTTHTSCPGKGITPQVLNGTFEPQVKVVEVPKPILELGSRGPEVGKLQDHLRFWSFYIRETNTNYYGTGTRSAVKRLQAKLGITQSGKYDAYTASQYKMFLEKL